MADHLREDGSFINSIVGEGTSFSGEIRLNGLLRIDGDFTGTVQTSGKVLVGKNGRAECTIRAGTVVIGGVVKGNIHAEEKVIILSTGMMIGNISTPRLIAEEGVILDGNCQVRKDENGPDRNQTKSEREANTIKFPDASRRSFVSTVRRAENPDGASIPNGEVKGGVSSWKG